MDHTSLFTETRHSYFPKCYILIYRKQYIVNYRLHPQGGYVIITINDNSSITDKDSIGVEFIRFNYDVEKAAKAVEDSPLPNEYADMLRKGY
jgi:hypothetical protein